MSPIFVLFCLLPVVFCPRIRGQQVKKIPRIGFITTGYPVSIAQPLEGSSKVCTRWLRGRKNVVLELRYGEAKAEQAQFSPPIWSASTWMSLSRSPSPRSMPFRRATQTIPIVMPIGLTRSVRFC